MGRTIQLAALVFAALSTTSAESSFPFVSDGFIRIPDQVTLDAVSAVDSDSKGNLYVLHRGEPPVLVFNKKGDYLRGWGQGAFEVAHGLRIDRDDNVWTTDNKQHIVRKFSPKGKLLLTVGEAGVGANDETHFRSPDDIGFSSSGELFIADAGNGRVVRLKPDGTFVSAWGSKGKRAGEFAAAHGITVDARDRVIVADRGNDRVQVFTADGEHVASWSGFGNPFGVLAHGSTLYVSDGDADRLIALSLADGRETSRWGDSETLRLPHLMAVAPDGRLFVTEVDGKRVQIFRPREKR